MPGPDPTHWLHRLTPEEWLRAAENELARAEAALGGKQHRAGVATARRAAGMAWNAVLAVGEDARFGRSYMDHLHALVDAVDVPETVRAAARALVEAPLDGGLVTLGARGDTRLADAARVIVEHARARAMPAAQA